MKYLLDYKKFLLQEEVGEDLPAPDPNTPPPAELATDPALDPTATTPAPTPEATPAPAPANPSDDSIRLQRSAVVVKKFFQELRTHLIYWFHHGEISQHLVADKSDIVEEHRGVSIWASDKNEKYEWKIKFLEPEVQGKIQRMEKVLLTIHVYDLEKEYLVKQTEKIIPVDQVSEDTLWKEIRAVKKTILKVPQDQGDVKSFKKKESDLLGDDIY